jgi:hypothetical protein
MIGASWLSLGSIRTVLLAALQAAQHGRSSGRSKTGFPWFIWRFRINMRSKTAVGSRKIVLKLVHVPALPADIIGRLDALLSTRTGPDLAIAVVSDGGGRTRTPANGP